MNNQVLDVHDEDAEIEVQALEVIDDGGVSAIEGAQISQQVATAKRYPRSVTKALREAETLATMDEETAASCFYVLPRGGKKIEGPSARLAEIMAYSWGNLRADAAIESEDRTHVTAVGTCFDMEKNVAVRVRVKRRITKKNGSRFDDDMIGVTGNAAISIALRNAVFKVIPQAFVSRIYHMARQASVGDAGTMVQKRQRAMEWFAKAGVSEDQVFQQLGVKGMDDVGQDELITLRGLVTALKDGETTVEQVFRRYDVSDGASELNEALAVKAKPEADPVLPLGTLEEMAGVGPNDRDAICAKIGIKSPAHDEAAYRSELDRIIAERKEAEA